MSTLQRATSTTGTFTPVWTFATPGDFNANGYASQVGTYIRNGSLVWINVNINAAAPTWTTASGALNITGLPFTSANLDANDFSFGSTQYTNITSATNVSARVAPNAAIALLVGSGAVAGAIAAANMVSGANTSIRFSLVYRAA